MESQKEGFFTVRDNAFCPGRYLLAGLCYVKNLDPLKGSDKALVSVPKDEKLSLPDVDSSHFYTNQNISGFTIKNIQINEIKRDMPG